MFIFFLFVDDNGISYILDSGRTDPLARLHSIPSNPLNVSNVHSRNAGNVKTVLCPFIFKFILRPLSPLSPLSVLDVVDIAIRSFDPLCGVMCNSVQMSFKTYADVHSMARQYAVENDANRIFASDDVWAVHYCDWPMAMNQNDQQPSEMDTRTIPSYCLMSIAVNGHKY